MNEIGVYRRLSELTYNSKFYPLRNNLCITNLELASIIHRVKCLTNVKLSIKELVISNKLEISHDILSYLFSRHFF